MNHDQIILEVLKTLGYTRKTLVSTHFEIAMQGNKYDLIRETEWNVECIDNCFRKIGPFLTDDFKRAYLESSSCPPSMPEDYQSKFTASQSS